MMVIESYQHLKWLIEMLVRIFGTGTITISWTFDGGEGAGGTMQISPSQGTDTWGGYDWGASDSATVLTWSSIDTVMQEFGFPANAQGRLLELEISTETSGKLQMTMISLGYKIHVGSQWLPK